MEQRSDTITIDGTNLIANHLTGSSQNDRIDGSPGSRDTMRGLAGNDTYFVDNAADVVNEKSPRERRD